MTTRLSSNRLDMFVDGALPLRERDILAGLIEIHPERDAYRRKKELLRRMLRGRYWYAGGGSARHQGRKVLNYGT